MAGTTSISAEEHCVRLRSLVHDCLAKHMYEAAAFFADKLVTLSRGAQPDVYILAQVGARSTLHHSHLTVAERLL
jgi:anaphase-promoting complex subunit 6